MKLPSSPDANVAAWPPLIKPPISVPRSQWFETWVKSVIPGTDGGKRGKGVIAAVARCCHAPVPVFQRWQAAEMLVG
jgi:hypothetical protein